MGADRKRSRGELCLQGVWLKEMRVWSWQYIKVWFWGLIFDN